MERQSWAVIEGLAAARAAQTFDRYWVASHIYVRDTAMRPFRLRGRRAVL